MRFRFLGFTIESDVALPELPADTGGEPRLILRHGEVGAPPRPAGWFHTIDADDGRPWLSIGRVDGAYLLQFHQGLTLEYRFPVVRWWETPGLSEESFRHLLLDQALPPIAAQAGHTVLHAACVVARDLPREGGSGGAAVLLVGPAGTGKSTLAGHLLAHGWRAAADDAAAVVSGGAGVLVRPAYAGLRLWPDSSAALGLAGASAVASYSDKRRVPAAGLPREDLRLHAIHILKVAPDPRCVPALHELTRREQVMALVRNAYVLDTEDRERAEVQLEALARLAERVPVRELILPQRFDALDPARAILEASLQREALRA
jgi:hypothetical protein